VALLLGDGFHPLGLRRARRLMRRLAEQHSQQNMRPGFRTLEYCAPSRRGTCARLQWREPAPCVPTNFHVAELTVTHPS
jgi:hypothetical protein